MQYVLKKLILYFVNLLNYINWSNFIKNKMNQIKKQILVYFLLFLINGAKTQILDDTKEITDMPEIQNNDSKKHDEGKKPEKNEKCKKILKYGAITLFAVSAAAALPIALGFGSAGVVSGSVAAGVQSGIGSVASGSLFSVAQSYGMTGAFSSIAGYTGVGGTISAIGSSLCNLKDNLTKKNLK